MRIIIPVLNTLNFAAIFLILYFIDLVKIETVGIATAIGFVIGFLVKLILLRETHIHKKRLPQKVSTKLIILPSVLLLILIALSILFIAGHNPFELEGQTTKEGGVEEEIEENETLTTTEEEDGEECTISDGIECIEYEVHGAYKRVTLTIKNQIGFDIKNPRAYINEPGKERFLCKLYCKEGCVGEENEIPNGGMATFIGDQYCRIPDSGEELVADTKMVYQGQTGVEYQKYGSLIAETI